MRSYIASPNSLAFVQAKAALSTTGKHVILEKPASFQPQEWLDLNRQLKNHCFIFEAARNYHEGSATTIEFLADKQIWERISTLCQVFFKMPDLLAGRREMFFRSFAGGALGLGIYHSLCCRSSLERLRTQPPGPAA